MGLVQPGLGERIAGLVGVVRAREAEAEDNPVGVGALKAGLTYLALALVEQAWRSDGTSGLDYDGADRTALERGIAAEVAGCLEQLVGLSRATPRRDWSEVEELAECATLLDGAASEEWRPELVQLGGQWGVTVARKRTSGGLVSFEAAGGVVTGRVYKALEPDTVLDGADVYLVEQIALEAMDFRTPVGALTGKYVVMVDDPYWGRRLQPEEFCAPPLDETFVMGYRVRGRVLHNGAPVEGANVSLEGITVDHQGVESRFWDSQEYNELIWSPELETWVEGPSVVAPIRTDADGRWSFVCPKGHGAIYQRAGDRRDESAETAGQRSDRHVDKLWMVYRGRRAELREGEEAVIDLLSGRLQITGEPGAWVRVGVHDEAGDAYLVPTDGMVTVTGLPSGEHTVVQFRRDAWGEWDSRYGCARKSVVVREGETATVDMGAMRFYDPEAGVIAGRVYERMGRPAVGVSILPLNYETGEFGEPIAETDESGYWEVEIPQDGLSGDPWVHDAVWGSVPVLGYPYSDVVLGARAYAGWQEIYKPELWRKGDRGHANFQYLQDGIWVEDTQTQQRYETEEAAYGGWVTVEALPKFRYVADPWELLLSGPQLREYSLWSESGVLQSSFGLRSQSFCEYEDLAGQFRASGYYPEAKFLIGGKVKGGVVAGHSAPIGVELPEALRLGLEFGEHEWYTQVRAERAFEGGAEASCWTDLLCPYCGGPTWRDPDVPGYRRGYCIQCADCFGAAEAMDGRTHFLTPGLLAGEAAYALGFLRVRRGGGVAASRVRRHWRPDLYNETDDYLVQGGLGQATNAPRWFARHVDEVDDGKGFGRFDLAHNPPFIAGHDLEYFGELPEVGRELGLSQVKLCFPWGYVQEEQAVVEVDCRRSDGMVETRRVVIPAGTRGPNEEDPVGQVIPVTPVSKSRAELVGAPYEGAGLYDAVTDVRIVEAPPSGQCRFALVNDGPLLAPGAGVSVTERAPTHVAWQIGGLWGGPHLLDDAVGQLFLFWGQEGEVWMTRRGGLPGQWETGRAVTSDGDNTNPTVEKDGTGRLVLLWEHAGAVARAHSVDDGGRWLVVGS
ncbi:MAG: hypothetical protein HPY69_06050 [Armatimonadetes bacterium]|nr:hypothetical protein [Armatimonadota bacterium]